MSSHHNRYQKLSMKIEITYQAYELKSDLGINVTCDNLHVELDVMALMDTIKRDAPKIRGVLALVNQLIQDDSVPAEVDNANEGSFGESDDHIACTNVEHFNCPSCHSHLHKSRHTESLKSHGICTYCMEDGKYTPKSESELI